MHQNGLDEELIADMYDVLKPAIWKIVNFYTWNLKKQMKTALVVFEHSDDYALKNYYKK